MKYSVIDISSSSISMIAADVTANAAEIVYKDRASLTLLHYLEGKSLSARGIDKLVEAVMVMKGKCVSLGVDILYLIATASLRAAENFEQVRAELLERTGLPVDFCDERGTTITAHEYLNATDTRGKRRKAVVDAVAATVILENYLAARRSRRAREGEA